MSRIWRSPALRWFALALAGLAVAVAVGYAASRVTSQRIGLASEPLQAGESLAPSTGGHRTGHGSHGGGSDGGHGDSHTTTATTTTRSTTTQTTSTAPPTISTTSGDDSSSGEGSSGGEDD
jgi:hypothetical protein